MKFKEKSARQLAILVLAILISMKAAAQFAIDNVEEIDKVKAGTTYIAMKDTGSVKSREYKEVFKKYWNFNKIVFINYADITDYISIENSFFTISGYETSTQMSTLMSNGTTKAGIDFSNTHIYLELWTCKDKYFAKKKSKEFSVSDKNTVARMELFTDFTTLMTPSNIYKTDYDGGNHIRNWGTGIIKNYIQQLMILLKAGEEQKLFDAQLDATQLKKLRTDTLFIPDYIFIKFNKFTGDETKTHDQADIMEDYKLKYKVVTIDELNKKINSSTRPFYYLIYIKSSTDKFINVINSETGEVTYAHYTPISYNIDPDDFKKLNAAVKKN
ncbi:hypothetical protein BH11BAC7_BH11BAC7_33300 [soil metagenome]